METTELQCMPLKTNGLMMKSCTVTATSSQAPLLNIIDSCCIASPAACATVAPSPPAARFEVTSNLSHSPCLVCRAHMWNMGLPG